MQKKTVILTGSSGFIGKELTRQLLEAGYKVRGLGFKDNSTNFKGAFEFINTDLRKESSQKYFTQADYCINLAAQIGGVVFMEDYQGTILDDNLKILSNTFSAAVKNKIGRMIYASSSMVYQKAKQYPSTEEMLKETPPPSNVYGFSKLAGEYYCKAYQKQFGLNYTILRIFNAYGPEEIRQNLSGHVMVDLINKIFSGQYPLELMGDPGASRPFIYLKDVASAFIVALENQKAVNNDFNIGNDNEIKIVALAKLLWKLCGRKEEFKVRWTGKVTDTSIRRGVNPSKLKKLGWQAKVPLEKGASEVIEWLKKETSKN